MVILRKSKGNERKNSTSVILILKYFYVIRFCRESTRINFILITSHLKIIKISKFSFINRILFEIIQSLF